MEQFKFKKGDTEVFKILEAMVKRGIDLGLDISELLKKVESIKQTVNDGIVRIVLLGSFSDGKTSAIAGLLGRLEDSMKIDQDESSDELKIYRPNGLKEGFEIVDTPGLFGTKEKEVDGRNVKFSDITKKYLSEAHIIIYVCDAVTPLKDSHVPIIKWIMRDLGKLDSTIFVINKMDEAGYDLTDEKDYSNGTNIKKQNLTSRLRNTINLTPEEERKLHIVCIAADPKGKGLAHWFAKSDEYMKRSHIGLLRDELNDVVQNSNAAALKDSAALVSIKEVMSDITDDVDKALVPTNKALKQCIEIKNDLSSELTTLKSELVSNRGTMQQQMDEYKAALLSDIKSATVETMDEVIDRAIGVQDGKATFYVFTSNVNQIMEGASNAAQGTLQSAQVKFEKGFSHQDEFMKSAVQNGAKYLSKVQISKDQVFAVRDTLFKSFKFKPWGATKMAANITKGFGWVAVGLSVGLEIYSFYKEKKANKELDKAKEDLTNALNDAFAKIYPLFSENDAFFKNFAPQFLDMKKQLDERTNELEKMQKKVEDLEQYKSKVQASLRGEYVDFEEV